MEAELKNPEFDSFLGGKQCIPKKVNLPEFIKNRMEEVVMLTEAIQESPFRGQAFQRLPKHMRRRQMSHHIKRLPRRLQRPYIMSLKEGVPPPTKRPSRKYRRKPTNLMLEYNRRQRTSTWLETHIWHAKRFHMTKKWGYSIPEKPVNKSFKACYRAISEHCLLIDHSYYNCIELEGPEDELCAGLGRCTAPECGPTFSARTCLSGKREGCTTLFHPDSYPYSVISNVRFMWRPAVEANARRKIWIWVHPLVYEEVVECFKSLFGLSPLSPSEDSPVVVDEEWENPRKKRVVTLEKGEDVIAIEEESLKREKLISAEDEDIIIVETLSPGQDKVEKKCKNTESDQYKVMKVLKRESEKLQKQEKNPKSDEDIIIVVEESSSREKTQKQENSTKNQDAEVESEKLFKNKNSATSNADEDHIVEVEGSNAKKLEKAKSNGDADTPIARKESARRKKLRQKKEKKLEKKIETIKLEPKNVPFVRTPKHTNGSLTMTLLKDTLNRFQLTGPLSHVIASQAFKVASVEMDFPEVEVMQMNRKRRRFDKEEKTEKNWWEAYYRDPNRMKNWIDQKTFYQRMGQWSKPTDVPGGMVLGLVVEDPRLTIPSKREKAEPPVGVVSQMAAESLDECLCRSPIWLPEVRDQVSSRKLSTQEINEARSRKIVPGWEVADVLPNEKKSRIPILLVQRPGRGDPHLGKVGLGSGWDIIAPAGFGMPIWLSLIFRGARPGGLRESKLLVLECTNLSGCSPPDSAAGETDSRENLRDLRMQYFKLPPNKRPNFLKLGVLSPFYAPWKVLVRDWGPEECKSEELSKLRFSVLRDYKMLKALEGTVNACPRRCSNGVKIFDYGWNHLIPVVVECSGKGKPKNLALLCLPEDEDLKDLSKPPVEPSHADENETQRKSLRKEHATLLKSLRRKRKQEKAKVKEMFANGEAKWKDVLEVDVASSWPHCQEYKAKMEALWLPDADAVDSVVQSCSRSVLGYVVRGEYSYSRARGCALGYVTLPGLARVLEVCEKKKAKAVVLVRNISEAQYRFGRLRIAVGS